MRSKPPSPRPASSGGGWPMTMRWKCVSSSHVERVLDGAGCLELEPQPREAIACTRRSGRHAIQRLRQRAAAIVNAGLGDDAKRDRLDASERHCERGDPRQHLRAQQPGEPAIGNDQPECPVGRVQQPLRDRQALLLVGVEQRRVRLALDDERELPSQVVGILQAGVHALRADRTVDVGRVAEQEAAPVAEARRAAMVDAVGGKPAARLDRQSGTRLVAQRGHHRVESAGPCGRAGPSGRMPTMRQWSLPRIGNSRWKPVRHR